MAGNWLNIAGGAAQGYNAGVEDDRRRQEFNFMQAQRARQLKAQKEDDELTAQLKAVPTPGDYESEAEVRQGAETEPNFVGPGSGVKKTKTTVTEPEYNRKMADVYGRSARPQDIATAATLRNSARQAEQGDRAEREAQARETLMQAGRMNASGDSVGAMRLLQKGYAKHPDGHEIVIQADANGVPHSAVAGPDGKFVTRLEPVNADSVNQMIKQGVSMLSPELMMKQQELGIQQTTAGAHVMSAQAAMKNADATYQDMLMKTGDEAKAKLIAETQYLKDTGRAHLISAEAARMHAQYTANMGKASQSQQFVDKQGNTVFMTPIRDKTGKITDWQKDVMPEGLTPLHQVAPWDKEQEFYAKELKDHEINGTGPYKLTKDGKVDQSKIEAYKKEHRLDKPPGGGISPVGQAILAQGAPAAAAPAAVPAPTAAPAFPQTRGPTGPLGIPVTTQGGFPAPVDYDPNKPGPVYNWNPNRPAPPNTIWQNPFERQQ